MSDVKWLSPTVGNAKRVPDAVWDGHKKAILQFYLEENRSLDEICCLMEERYNFNATKRQYVHRVFEKWGVKKYHKRVYVTGTSLSSDPSAKQPALSRSKVRSRSNTPLIPPSEKDKSSSKARFQATVEDVPDDGDYKAPDPLGPELTTFQGMDSPHKQESPVIQQAEAPSAVPTQSANGLPVAMSETGVPPGAIKFTLRDVAQSQTLRKESTQQPVAPSPFPTQSPSMAVRPASKDSDDCQNTRHPARLSCPYRKLNPLRFNVRDHQSCATQPYPDISQLKRHVKVFHKRRHVERCPRCKKGFGTKAEVNRHLLVPSSQICDVKALPPPDPEDGITDAIEDCLNGRKANTKIDSWESLWRLLFPNIQPAEPDFYRVREHFELEEYLLQKIPDSETELRLRLLPLLQSFHLTSLDGEGTDASRDPDTTTLTHPVASDPPAMTVRPVALDSEHNQAKRKRLTNDDPEYSSVVAVGRSKDGVVC